MISEITIRINDSETNLVGNLDIPSGSDFPLVLNSSVSNIRNLSLRSGTFAYTFNIPATSNNNRILQSIYNSDQRKDVKDVLNKHTATVIVNGIQFDRGYIKVLNYDKAKKSGQYEMNYFGANLEWVKDLGELSISELPFRQDLQDYTLDQVQVVQASNVDNYDFTYALMNRGGWDYANAVSLTDFYPDLYVKAIFDLAFRSIGWKIESDFLNSDVIKKVCLSFSGDFKFSETDKDDKTARIGKEGSIVDVDNPFPALRIDFTDETSDGYYDNGNNFNTSTYAYTPNATRYYNFKLKLKVRSRLANANSSFLWYLVDSGGQAVYTSAEIVPPVPYPRTDDSFAEIEFETGFLFLEAGESYAFEMKNTNVVEPLQVGPGSFLQVDVQGEIDQTMQYTLSEVWANKDYKVIDVITDFFKVENLHIQPDNRTRTVYIEPRDTFFDENSSAFDLTEFVDHSNPVSLDFISTYKRELKYSFKDDTKDGWVKGFNEKNGTRIGEYTHTLPERFEKGQTVISTKLVAPTVMMRDVSIKGKQIFSTKVDPDESAPIIARLWSDSMPDSEGPGKRTDFAPRFFHYVYGQQFNSFGQARRFLLVADGGGGVSNRTVIPAAVSYSYENTNVDHNFLFEGENGLFEKRYRKDTQIIEEGLILTFKAKLKAEHLQNLDFRKKYYIGYPDNIKGYYILNSYSDYNPAKDGLVSLELLKVKQIDGAILQKKDVLVEDLDPGTLDDSREKADTGFVKEGGGVPKEYTPKWPGPDGNDGRTTGFVKTPSVTSGVGNKAVEGRGSYADGIQNVSNGTFQVVTGRFNEPNETDIFQVGTGDNNENRRNAISVDEDGTIQEYGGEIYYLNASGEMTSVFYTSVKGNIEKTYKK